MVTAVLRPFRAKSGLVMDTIGFLWNAFVTAVFLVDLLAGRFKTHRLARACGRPAHFLHDVCRPRSALLARLATAKADPSLSLLSLYPRGKADEAVDMSAWDSLVWIGER